MEKSAGRMLVTGAAKGLGRHLTETFSAIGFTRHTPWHELETAARKMPFDVILHCAFNPAVNVNSTDMHSWFNDNVLLTQKLLELPHKKFIFISSSDVYPKSDRMHFEQEVITLSEVGNVYGMVKLMCESLVMGHCAQSLILRPTAMLGPYARPNSLTKILSGMNPLLTLSATSTFNYILHQDVSDFIRFALDKNLNGIYNLAAADNIALGDISRQFKKDAHFGDFVYQAGSINNQKAADILTAFRRTSLSNIQHFLQIEQEKAECIIL